MERDDASLEELPASEPARTDNSGHGAAPLGKLAHDNFIWRHLIAAGLGAVAEKTAAGRELELDDALALSRAGLALLGKMVQLQPSALAGCETAVAGGLPVERVTSLPKSPRHIGQPLTDWESFCQALITLRSKALPNGATAFWYPIVDRPLDRDCGCSDEFTGVEVLRAIALARLILPAKIQVQAPLATFGPKLAQVALDFGASHLGYVAPDGQTSNDPLVADAGVLEELLGSCLPTSLKEEPALPS